MQGDIGLRDYVLHGFTVALCSSCGARVGARIILQGGAVYLLKRCEEHGLHREILEEDASFYLRGPQYDKPGTASPTQTAYKRGCPYDCGLCPDHDQHTCIALLEVTGRCDLHCPVCYADSGTGDFLPLPDVERMLDFLQECEGGKAQILQISGGEPTLHLDVVAIIQAARERGIRYVMLNTNGLRLARDPSFAEDLARFRGGFEVYLQFDGFDAASQRRLRGRDFLAEKKQALSNLAASGIPVTLVSTIERGVNDREVGRIVEFGINTEGVRGINFQPIAYFGRHPAPTSEQRVTRTGILRLVEEQTGGMLRMSDFIPLPCNVDRVAITYLLRTRAGYEPVTRKADVRKYLPLIDNTLAFYAGDLISAAARELTAGGDVGACCGLARDAQRFMPHWLKAATSRDRTAAATRETFRISVTSFLDRFNFDMKSMKKECVHVLTPDLCRIPFSAYNLIHRGSPVRTEEVCDGIPTLA